AGGKRLQKLEAVHEVVQAALSPDGKMLAAHGDADEPQIKQAIRLWDVDSGKEIRTIPVNDLLSQDVSSAVFSPDGRTLASASSSSPKLLLWEVATGKQVRTFESRPGMGAFLAFTPDGTRLIGAHREDGTVHVWETATGKRTVSTQGPRCNFTSLA